jgi:hypothetical protein
VKLVRGEENVLRGAAVGAAVWARQRLEAREEAWEQEREKMWEEQKELEEPLAQKERLLGR